MYHKLEFVRSIIICVVAAIFTPLYGQVACDGGVFSIGGSAEITSAKKNPNRVCSGYGCFTEKSGHLNFDEGANITDFLGNWQKWAELDLPEWKMVSYFESYKLYNNGNNPKITFDEFKSIKSPDDRILSSIGYIKLISQEWVKFLRKNYFIAKQNNCKKPIPIEFICVWIANTTQDNKNKNQAEWSERRSDAISGVSVGKKQFSIESVEVYIEQDQYTFPKPFETIPFETCNSTHGFVVK